MDLMLETKYDLRTTPYNTILESLATDQVDNRELHDLLMKDVTEIVKRIDGTLVLKVTSAALRTALSKHRVKLCGNEYAFKAEEVLDHRFFFDVINFSYDDGIPALIDELLKAGFTVTTCAKKVNLASSNLSTPMLRVFTADMAIPDVALFNGSPMDQIAFGGKTFMVNCKGSRSGANPRTRSPHCLDLSDRPEAPPAQAPAQDSPGDVDMSDPTEDAGPKPPSPTIVELARSHAPVAAYPQLSEAMAWKVIKPKSRLSASLRTKPTLKVQWVDGNQFAILDTLDLETECYTCAADPAEPPTSCFVHAHRLSLPAPQDLDAPLSFFPVRETDDETDQCVISSAPLNVEEFDHSIATFALINGEALGEQVQEELFDVHAIDLRFRDEPSYDAIERAFHEKPIAANVAMFNYIRMKDSTLEELVGMHMFVRGLAVKTLDLGTTYADEYFGLLPQPRELSRDPAQQWMQHLSTAPRTQAHIIKVNRTVALFELLLRGTAPGLEQSDELLMLLCRTQVHWLSTKDDRFLHPATLLAIAATEVGQLILNVGLANDPENADLRLLKGYLEDDAALVKLFRYDLALEVIVVDGLLGARTVSDLAEY
ncbi:hypothetical protein Gpo141_00009445 [Globisporangium polare]